MHMNHDHEHGDADLTVQNTTLLHGFFFGWLGLPIRSWEACWSSAKFHLAVCFSTSLPATASSSSQDASLGYTPHTPITPPSIYIIHTYCIHSHHIRIHATSTTDTHTSLLKHNHADYSSDWSICVRLSDQKWRRLLNDWRQSYYWLSLPHSWDMRDKAVQSFGLSSIIIWLFCAIYLKYKTYAKS